jgi:hypothetical protein
MRSIAYDDLVFDENVQRFSNFSSRGILTTTGVSKWLYSKLYGVWRGQIQDSLYSIIENLSPGRTREFFTKISRLPSVSNRMSVYQSLQNLDLGDDSINELSWGFVDKHPWVRRTALEWSLRYGVTGEGSEFTNVIMNSILDSDPNVFPGNLDLLNSFIKVAKFQGFSSQWINEKISPMLGKMSPVEVRSLEWSLRNDLLPHNFVNPNRYPES